MNWSCGEGGDFGMGCLWNGYGNDWGILVENLLCLWLDISGEVILSLLVGVRVGGKVSMLGAICCSTCGRRGLYKLGI